MAQLVAGNVFAPGFVHRRFDDLCRGVLDTAMSLGPIDVSRTLLSITAQCGRIGDQD